jgi:facilitated trehalose transporter
MAALSVSLGSMVVGFASAYTSPALVSMAEPNSTVQPDLQQVRLRLSSLAPHAARHTGGIPSCLMNTVFWDVTLVRTDVMFVPHRKHGPPRPVTGIALPLYK